MRLNFLDGVRGWASLSVLLFHASWEMFGAVVPAFRFRYGSIFNHGFFAVCVFFVLSGMVLSVGFFRQRDLAIIRRLAVRRYLRLTMPILAVSLLAYAAMTLGLLHNQQAAAILHRADWLGTFYRQAPSLADTLRFGLVRVYFNYQLATSYDVFLWTMPIELLGSFVVFALLALSGPGDTARYFWCAAVLAVSWQYSPATTLFLYGVVLADCTRHAWFRAVAADWRGDMLGLLLVGSVIAGVALFRSTLDIAPSGEMFHLFGPVALLLVAGISLSPRLRGLLAGRLSRFLADISFPLYLTHSLVLCTLSSFLVERLTGAGLGMEAVAWTVFPILVAVSLLVATLFRPVERLAITLSHRFSAAVLREPAIAVPL